MAGVAPTLTQRVTPSGFKMPDGFQSLITFASKPSIQLWEKAVKPPSENGGDGIDTTTMHNVKWRTKDARHLITIENSTFQAAYDPDVIADIRAIINQPTSITFKYPDGSTDVHYGYLQKAERQELKEGEFPMMNCEIVITNWDPVNFAEQGPVFTPAPGI